MTEGMQSVPAHCQEVSFLPTRITKLDFNLTFVNLTLVVGGFIDGQMLASHKGDGIRAFKFAYSDEYFSNQDDLYYI